jgi:hypothetical protein
MTAGARNIHALAGALDRLRHEAAAGPCRFHPKQSAVGFIESWDLRQTGVCEACKKQGEGLGYTVHPDPWDGADSPPKPNRNQEPAT